MYGWRARIGLIIPSLNVTIEPELNAMAPEGVSIHVTRLLLEKGTADELHKMASDVEKAGTLLSTATVDIIVYACTTGSLLGGKGWEMDIIKRIEHKTDTQAMTTAGAVIEALKELNITRVAVATPYIDELNNREKRFIEEHGIGVVRIEGLGFTKGEELHNLSPEVAYSLGRKVDRDEAQAVFLSSTDLKTIGIIEALEKDIGKPVVSSNTATLWAALRRLEIKEPIEGYGELLRRV
mgnify:CR=1 FL=1